MNKNQFRIVCLLLSLLLVGQAVQTLLLLQAQRVTQKTAESAEASATDVLEMAKRARQSQPETDRTQDAKTLPIGRYQ